MNKYFFLVFLMIPFVLFSQKTKILSFDYKNCNDVLIWNLDDQNSRFGKTNDLNFGKSEYFDALVWTWDGSYGIVNSLIYFNISSIASNAEIVSAKLSLYTFDELIKEQFSSSESYEIYIQKVISSWDEDKVTWNTRPDVNDKDKFIVPDKADFTNIDITNLVKDWIKKPSENYGIMISSTKLSTYRGIAFCSSEFPDKSLRPLLTITYKEKLNGASKDDYSAGNEKENNNECSNNQILIVFDQNFIQLFKEQNVSSDRIAQIIESLSTGKYLFQLINEKNSETTSFQIIKN